MSGLLQPVLRDMSPAARRARVSHVLLFFGTCLFAPVSNDTWSIGQAHAAPAGEVASDEQPPLPRPVQRRLELWRRPADTGLTARYQLTRKSSRLYEPLTTAGTLTFTPPDRLELRDDGPTGATTQIAGTAITITANGDPPQTPLPETSAPRRWLREHFLKLLAANSPDALRQDARIRNLGGPGTAFELTPPPGHPAGRAVRELRIQIDPNSGEILLLVLAEASGDLVTISLAQHRRGP